MPHILQNYTFFSKKFAVKYYICRNVWLFVHDMPQLKQKHGWKLYLALFGASLLLFFVYLQLYTQVLGWELPKTKSLRRENASLMTRAEILDHEMDVYGDALAAIEIRDEDIYRSIFGLNSIPSSIREGGYHSKEHYDDLYTADRKGLIRDLNYRSDKMAKRAYIQSKSFDEVEAVLATADNMATSIPAISPVAPERNGMKVSSPYGFRYHPVLKTTRFHSGMDFQRKSGNPVYATGDATVEAILVEMYGYGRQVVLNHGFGYKTRYAHLNAIFVTEGMKVTRGQLIATTGNTGLTSGPHLHYEVIYKGQNVNPAHYFDWDMTPEQYKELTSSSNEAADPYYVHPSHRK